MPAETQPAAGCSLRSSARQRRQPREGGRRLSPQRGDRHQPAQPQRPAGRDQVRQPRQLGRGGAATSGGRRRRVEVHLDQHVQRPARLGARRRPARATSRARSTECTTSAYVATDAALLVCSCPTKCQRRSRSAHAAALGAASWSRFSPTSRTPSSTQRAHVGRREGLGDDHDRDGRRVATGGVGCARHAFSYGGQTRTRSVRRGSGSGAVGTLTARPARRRRRSARSYRRGGRSSGPATRPCRARLLCTVTPRSASSAVRPARRSSAAVPVRLVDHAAGATAATSARMSSGTS